MLIFTVVKSQYITSNRRLNVGLSHVTRKPILEVLDHVLLKTACTTKLMTEMLGISDFGKQRD